MLELTLDASMVVAQRLSMHPSPVLIVSAELLALPSLDLEERIEREVAENPALERLDPAGCPRCGLPLAGSWCAACDRDRSVRLRANQEPEHERMERIADRPSLPDRLLNDLRLLIGSQDLAIAQYLVGSLDERGFLDLDLESAAAALGVDPQRLVAVLTALREVGPPGIAARDLRECLLLQIDRLAAASGPYPLARAVVSDHLEDLARGRLCHIARALNASEAEVAAARDFIRNRLVPYPAAVEPEMWEPAPAEPALVPDLVVTVAAGQPDRFEVEVVERWRLGVDSLYRTLADRATPSGPDQGRRPPSGNGALSSHEYRQLRSFVRQAEFFVGRLRDRYRTLRRVGRNVMDQQTAFLRWGPGHLVRLTRAQVAEALGLHESTVSRAVADKYVLLPSGKMIPFRDFFDAALPVREALRQLIVSEEHPMSDGELSEHLNGMGYRIARRTVAKYRDRIGVLPWTLRRSATPHPGRTPPLTTNHPS